MQPRPDARRPGQEGGAVGFGFTFCQSIPTGAAEAVTYGFSCITGNSLIDCGIGEAQLAVDVTDRGGNQVAFTFTNAGPAASSIADVYWDDGSLLGIATITNGPGVSFSTGCSPGNLPGGTRSARRSSPPSASAPTRIRRSSRTESTRARR